MKIYSFIGVIAVIGIGSYIWFTQSDRGTNPAAPNEAPFESNAALPPSSTSGKSSQPARPDVSDKPKSVEPGEIYQPKAAYSLSPTQRSLNDAVLDTLERKDGVSAKQLVMALQNCNQLGLKQSLIDLERANPVNASGVTAARIREQSDQLARSTSECQTIGGDPALLQAKLAQIAMSAGVPGAALMMVQLDPSKASPQTLDMVVKDARSGDLMSLAATILDRRYLVSDAERIEMALALRETFSKVNPIGSDIALYYGQVADYYWNSSVARAPGSPSELRSSLYERKSPFTLPPDLNMPSDPSARARVSALTDQLTIQVLKMEKEREEARKIASIR